MDEVSLLTEIHHVRSEAFASERRHRDLRTSGTPKTTAPVTKVALLPIAVEAFGIGSGQDPAKEHYFGQSHYIGESCTTCFEVAQKEMEQLRGQAAG